MTPHSTRPSTFIATARTALALAAAALLITGCAGLGTPKTPEEQVAKRAQERLDALLARDVDKAYSYTTPTFRTRETRNQYAARYRGAVNWTDAKIGKVTCQEDRCDVEAQITYEMARPRISNTSSLDERWVKVDNQWYIYLR